MYLLQNYITENDDGSGYGRIAFFMSTLTDELADELSDMDEIKIRLFMYQIGEVISWIGHGDNERLPEAVKSFADMVTPPVKQDNDNEIVDAEIVEESGNADNQSGTHIGIGT